MKLRTAIDANVLSALFSFEPSSSLMAERLYKASIEGSLSICAAAHAEILAHPTYSIAQVSEFLLKTEIKVDYMPDPNIWLLAGTTFRKYAERRRESRGGEPKRFLMDFIVGAHASLHADRLITLDRSPYTRDFPKLRLQ